MVSLVSRPEEVEEEKGPGFSRSCTRVIIPCLSMRMCRRANEKCFHCHMVSSLMSIVYSELKQRVYLCTSITMSVINACLLTLFKSKNSIVLFSTTGIQHKLPDRIAYLLKASGNESIISRRYHPKTSFPPYTDSIVDHCSSLGLCSGLSSH